MRGLTAVLIIIGFQMTSWAELEAPVLQFPATGEQIQLLNDSTQLQLRWSRVANATGYLLDVSGPPGFGSFDNAAVDQESSNPFVTYPINNLVAGDYIWSVSALNSSMIASSTPSSFTILSGTVGGGELIPPILLFPPDLAFAEVTSILITFRWAPVAGATQYLLQIPGAFPTPIEVEGGQTEVDVPLLIQGSRIYQWNVTAVNDEGQGEVSKNHQFLLTNFNWKPTEISYRLASDWFTLDSVLNVHPDPPSPQGEPITNHYEATELIPYQRDAKPSLTTGEAGPTLISPASGAEIPLVDSNNDLFIDTKFEWQFPSSKGYEFQFLDEEMNLIVTHLLPHPTTGENPSTLISRTIGTGNFFWRVRALVDDGSEATPFSETQAVTIVFPNLN